MMIAMHPEDVKAGIRKRYGTVAEFERRKGLPAKSVTEVLRGRKWRRVSDAVEAALQENTPQYEPSDSSGLETETHRLNAGAR